MSENSKKGTNVSDPFRKVVLAELTQKAANDRLFAISFQKENKNIDDCISYVLNTVQKSGIQGFTDDEVFGMAAHYYDEDDIEAGKEMKCKVIVNHTVQLTPEEINKAKQKPARKLFPTKLTACTKNGSEKTGRYCSNSIFILILMKPRNKHQERIVLLSSKLPKITEKQKQWAIDNHPVRLGFFSRNRITCLECNHKYKPATALDYLLDSEVCPACGRTIKLIQNGWDSLDKLTMVLLQ